MIISCITKVCLLKKEKILYEICCGMSFLHKNEYCHRDLKSPNVLIASGFNVRIADFGYARKAVEQTMTAIGTPAWTAPEVLKRERFDESCDVYSFGVICWELASEKVPYEHVDPIQVALGVLDGSLKLERLDEENCDLLYLQKTIDDCMNHDPSKRPTFQELIQIFEQK